MMMNPVAVTHVAFEDAGIITSVLAERGMQLDTYAAWNLPDTAEVAPLLIILGGPISANDEGDFAFLRDEMKIVQARFSKGLPTLGICLGAQIMTRAIGGTVEPGAGPEIGWSSVELTGAGKASCLAPLEDTEVLHWHGEVCRLPKNIQSLAHTPLCAAQAFSPVPNALGLQFHLEVGAGGIEPWLVGHSHEIAATPDINPRMLRAQSDICGPRIETCARNIFHSWFSEVGIGA